MAEGIYKFEKELDDGHILTGQFIADSMDIDNANWQKFEFLDWHYMVEPGDIELITSDKKALDVFKKYDLSVGFNPLENEHD